MLDQTAHAFRLVAESFLVATSAASPRQDYTASRRPADIKRIIGAS